MALDLKSFAIGKANGGGGGGIAIEKLTATENGTYTAESGKAFNPVVVDVNTGFDMSVTENQIKTLLRIPKWNKKQLVRFICTEANSNCTIDWGDGTVDNVVTEKSLEYAKRFSHEYSKSGLYIVTITGLDSPLYIGSINMYFCLFENNLITNNNMNTNTFLRKGFNTRIVEINIGEKVVIFDGIKSVPNFYIENKGSFFNNLFRFQQSGMCECYVPYGATKILSYAFLSFVGEYIKLPSTITEIGNNAFDGTSSVSVIDLTEIQLIDNELPIILSATNVFRDLGGYIVFADEDTANVAKNSTNWSVYADKIKYLGEVTW